MPTFKGSLLFKDVFILFKTLTMLPFCTGNSLVVNCCSSTPSLLYSSAYLFYRCKAASPGCLARSLLLCKALILRCSCSGTCLGGNANTLGSCTIGCCGSGIASGPLLAPSTGIYSILGLFSPILLTGTNGANGAMTGAAGAFG